MAELVFRRLGEARLRLPIDRDRFRLGRGADNHLILDGEDFSPHGAVLELREEGWWIVDASGKGTRVDQTRVETEAPLQDGAVIHLGESFTATFHLGVPSSPGETRRSVGQTRAMDKEEGRAGRIRLAWTTAEGERHMTLEPGDTIGIGKEDGNRLVLFDDYVSAFHARIYHHKGAWH
ncbi:MAG: FHA domain-containing protein, partial [Myxococcota bacterium]